MPTKNYVFGAYAPTVNLTSVEAQMLAAHRYRNKLCELERARRDASDATIRRLSPEYAAAADHSLACEERAEAAWVAIKKLSADARCKVAATPEMEAELKSARQAEIDSYAVLKTTKSAAFAILKEKQAELRSAANKLDVTGLGPGKAKSAIKDRFLSMAEESGLDGGQAAFERDSKKARAECGCYWGTYLLVEDAAKAFGQGPPPQFKRFEGDGTIGVQIQSGSGSERLTIERAISCEDSRLQLVIPNLEELHTRGKSRGLRSQGIVRMRIGSNPDRSPIWAEVPVRWHRPLPMNSDIRIAALHRNRVGTHFEWSLRLVIVEPEVIREPELPGSVVALHLGWRLVDGGLRVAMWKGSDGEHGFHVLSDYDVRSDGIPPSLASIRDTQLNRRKPRLLKWIEDNRELLPEWFIDESEYIDKWRSPERFYGLCIQWRNNRETMRHIPHEDIAFRKFERWRKWDKHLFEWQANTQVKVRAKRDDGFRCLAKKLASKYEFVAIVNTDYKKLAEKADQSAGEKDTQSTVQRRNARLASPGRLTQFVKEKFAGRVLTIPAKDVTNTCHVCGKLNKFDHRKLEHRCVGCAIEWDQDVNAVENQLASGLLLVETQAPLDGVMQQEVADESVLPVDGSEASKKATARKSRRNRRLSQLNSE